MLLLRKKCSDKEGAQISWLSCGDYEIRLAMLTGLPCSSVDAMTILANSLSIFFPFFYMQEEYTLQGQNKFQCVHWSRHVWILQLWIKDHWTVPPPAEEEVISEEEYQVAAPQDEFP